MTIPLHPSDTNKKTRRPTNVSLSVSIVDEAKRLDINLSRACERGLVEEIREARARRWLAENGEALEAANTFVETHGIPLRHLRKF
jgi:antitoxin CcdA